MIPANRSSFIAHDLTAEEYIVAVTLNDLQYKQLQNLKAAAAEEKVLLQYDNEKPYLVVAQEAYLRGQIDLISHILELSDNRQAALAELAKQKANEQSVESSSVVSSSDTNQF